MGWFAAVVVGFTFLANLLICLLVLNNNWRSWTNRWLGLLTLVLASWTVGNYLALLPGPEVVRLFWVRMVMAVTSLMGVTTFLLAKSFPGEKLEIGRKWLIVIWMDVLITALLGLSPWMFTGLENLPNGSFNLIPGPAIALFAINHFGFTVWGLGILIVKLRKSRGKLKQQMVWFLMGNLLTLTLITLTNFVAVVFFKSLQYTFIGPTFTLFLVGFVAYAILRHRLLDVRLLVVRSLAFTLVVVIAAFLYGGVFELVRSYVIRGETAWGTNLAFVSATLVVALSWQRVVGALKVVTGRFFYKEDYDFEKLLSGLSRVMASTLLLEDLMNGVMAEVVKKMKVSQVASMVLDKDGREVWGKSGNEVKRRLLDKIAGSVTIFEETPESELKETMRREKVYLIMKLEVKNELVGGVFLGEKLSGDSYSDKDVRVIEILAPELAVAVKNALSYHQIQLFNVTLQEEVKKATAELRVANDKLKELDKLKDEFISIASHELKSPAGVVKNYVWSVLNGKTKLGDEARGDLEKAAGANTRLVELVNDLLDVSRIESGRLEMHLEEFDLGELVTEVGEEYQPKAKLKKIGLKADKTKAKVKADKNKMHQVVANLIDNAIKFTPEEGEVIVKVIVIGGKVRVEVTDTGVGIDEKNLSKLFTKFGRVDTSGSAVGRTTGTGLGLYVSRKLVELAGGTMGVKSKPGEGSTFYFSLPVV